MPTEIDSLSDITIAIVGAKSTGKSHYIAVLIQRIIQLFHYFDWVLEPLTESTIDVYRQRFYNPLYQQRKRLETTDARANIDPLMYSLRFRKKNKSIMLVFFDAAGELFTRGETMERSTRYICNASGIICLVDPLQLRGVREELKKRGMELPDVASTGADDIMSKITHLLEHNGQRATKNIQIPLAVAISKIDALRTSTVLNPGEEYYGTLLFDDNNILFRDSEHKGYCDTNEIDTIHALLHNWTEGIGESSLLHSCHSYKDYRFFGFSALGAPPKGDQLSRTPTPIRVEDAFLWILAKNGFIKLK